MTDDLYARLRAANPVPAGAAVEPATSVGTRHSMEAAMSLNTSESSDTVGSDSAPATQPARRGSVWFTVGIAAAAAGVAVAGSLLLPDMFGDHATVATSALSLSMPGGDSMMSCLPVSVDTLKHQELAFAGTATSVTESTVSLHVDDWYLGGNDATEVKLSTGPIVVGYSLDFQEGGSYLISATDGAVSICGLSGEASPELQSLFDAAYRN